MYMTFSFFITDGFDKRAVVFGADSGNGLFSRKSLISICTQYDNHILNTLEMQATCCRNGDSCFDSWSLGNYIALMNNRTSCQDIQETDILNVQELLRKCAPYYQQNNLDNCKERSASCPHDVPEECLSFDHAVYFIFHYLVPTEFSENAKLGNFDLSSTILFLPNRWIDQRFYEAVFQNKHMSDGETTVVALGFGSLKFSLFSDFLLSDTLYIGLGAGLVVVIIWVYTGSLFITLMTVISMLMSLVIAYFAFVVMFNLPFFPFVNVASAVLIIGIGADDTFVYFDIWCQTKCAHPLDHKSLILRKTLQHASITMLVTSLTTASALYSSIVSSITAVRCFGVYSGTAIIVNFIFTVTWLPATVVIYSRFQDWSTKLTNPFPGGIRKLHEAHSVVATAYRTFFEHYLPVVVIRLRYVWIVTLASLGAGAFCVVFISPRLQLPNKAEFQVFRDSDLFELYDNVYKPMFDFNIQRKYPLYIAVVFGVRAVDGGDHWNPDDEGTLILEPTFNMYHPDTQKWLLEICRSFQNQSFYDHESQATCFMDLFKSTMEAPCLNASTPCCGQVVFPYPSDLFKRCLKAGKTCPPSYDCSAESLQPGPVFSKVDGAVKAFFMHERSSRQDTMEFKYIDNFWTEANAWLDEQLKTKPAGLTGGWLTAGSTSYSGQQLYFFNLQTSLARGAPLSMTLSLVFAAVVLLLTTWNPLISLYAVLSIAGAFFVTVGTLVLLDWRLNIFESAILSLAVGLSVDFTIHYGVAYRLAPSKEREQRTVHSVTSVGSAITVAALSTFVAGAMMMPSTVITYVQLGVFLMLVMTISWVYATFFFLSICRVIGPQGNCAQIPIQRCCHPCVSTSKTGPERANNMAMVRFRSVESDQANKSLPEKDVINQTDPAENGRLITLIHSL